MKILILGGYGVFGGRLAELLADMSGLEILVCGRKLTRAEAFCTGYKGRPKLTPVALDRQDIKTALHVHAPGLVVDASGPFQDYGTERYAVIEACLEAHIDYLDFADAADFVFGVSQFDAHAKSAGVFVLSGVSSFPVLTAAVLREIAKEMDVVSIQGGIAPSPYAGIGLNVMRAVAGYAGAPVKLWRDGKHAHGIGLAESMRYTVAVPGKLPLRNVHFSLVDVPDLQVIPPEHATMKDIWMGAGPTPEILHRMLNLLAKARARFGLPSFEPLSVFFYTVLNLLRFGEHRGGMFVHAHGLADGNPTEMSWHMLAEGDDGPYIPSMAIEAIIRKLQAGERPQPGARSGAHALDLADYERLFRRKTIFTGFRRDEPTLPLFRKVLGSAFDDLQPRLRELHESLATRDWHGFAEVRRGQGIMAQMISALFGFPKAANQVPVSVTITPEKDGERWTRDFGGRRFSSVQSPGSGKDTYLLLERFGIVTVALALVLHDGRLAFVPRRWRVLGVPLPGFLLPSGASFETQEGNDFCFDIDISLPLIGPIVAYKGRLQPAQARQDLPVIEDVA